MTYGKGIFANKGFGLEPNELDDDICAHEFQVLPEKKGRAGGRRLAQIDYRLVTFAACRPLGPRVTSNSTAWPSFSDL